jgi:hypothetical protein
MTVRARFNKQNLLNQLQYEITRMEDMWGFVSDNGTDQIKDKSDFDRAVAYGEYVAITDIADSIRQGNFFI